jgi:hypothetical protein
VCSDRGSASTDGSHLRDGQVKQIPADVEVDWSEQWRMCICVDVWVLLGTLIIRSRYGIVSTAYRGLGIFLG